MPDNSFENKLSRQLEDFKYPASDAVWQKLEANLQKRKKRRWAIIWFFGGLILISAGLYFIARPADPMKGKSLVSKKPKADISERLSEIPMSKSTDKMLIPVRKSQSKEIIDRQFIVKKEKAFNRQKIIKRSSENNVVDSIINKKMEQEKKDEAPSILTTVPLLEKEREKQPVENTVIDSASALKSSDSKKNTDSITVTKIPPAKETNKRGLSFGIRFEAGRSANSESSLTKNRSADLVSSPIAGGPIVYSNPFTQKPGFAFSIGAWLRKPISQRVNIQTGLMYLHYRTRASQGDSSNYTNTYHLLSIPIEIAMQLNKGKKLPVQWHLGIEPGWMVGSNAIVQDTSGFLSSDKIMYNRFQFGLQTGISFRFFQKTQHPLELGPVFKYMLTPTFKSVSSYDGHLNFLGLRADWKIFKIKSK